MCDAERRIGCSMRSTKLKYRNKHEKAIPNALLKHTSNTQHNIKIVLFVLVGHIKTNTSRRNMYSLGARAGLDNLFTPLDPGGNQHLLHIPHAEVTSEVPTWVRSIKVRVSCSCAGFTRVDSPDGPVTRPIARISTCLLRKAQAPNRICLIQTLKNKWTSLRIPNPSHPKCTRRATIVSMNVCCCHEHPKRTLSDVVGSGAVLPELAHILLSKLTPSHMLTRCCRNSAIHATVPKLARISSASVVRRAQ